MIGLPSMCYESAERTTGKRVPVNELGLEQMESKEALAKLNQWVKENPKEEKDFLADSTACSTKDPECESCQ